MSTGDTIGFMLVDASNAPKTNATPTFTAYRNRAGVARTPPAISHVGGGVYRFQPSTTDVLEGIAWAVDAGGGATPARLAGSVCAEATPFAVLMLTDTAGALWAGAAPTVGVYKDPSGTDRTPPALVAAAGAYLYTLTPSSTDLATGVEFRLDTPVGASFAYASGAFAVATTVDPAQSSAGEPSGMMQGTITYASIASRDQYGKPTMSSPTTSRARIQSTRQFVRDAAGETVQANFVLYLPPSLPLTLQHRIWLTSEGDSIGNPLASRRIIQIDKMRDGVGAARFMKVYV